MAIFKADCPNCRIKGVAFTVLCEKQRTDLANGDPEWEIFGQCGYCDRCAVAVIEPPRGTNPASWLDRPDEGEIPGIREFATVAPAPCAPSHTPENAKRFYDQGLNCMSGSWDAAGAMFRAALEAGLKEKFPNINENNLAKRIERAAKQGALTSDLAEWMNQIRLYGNEALHNEEPFSEKQARDMQAFTELVLQYLFTLPCMLKRAKDTAGSAIPGATISGDTATAD